METKLEKTDIVMETEEDMTWMIPVEILERIFRLLSFEDLKKTVLVCRRWRQAGDSPGLWSNLPLILNKRNLSELLQILSTRRRKTVKKIVFETPIPGLVLQHVLIHEGTLRSKLETLEFKDSILTGWDAKKILAFVTENSNVTNLIISGSDLSLVDAKLMDRTVAKLITLDVWNTQLTQSQAEAILKNILSKDSRLTDLNIAENNLSSVNVRLLGEAVTKMESVDIGDTILTTQQIEAILTEICKNTNLTNLNMSGNNLSSVEPGLLARAVSQIETIDIGDTSLTSRHMEDILRTALEEKSKLANLFISQNGLGSSVGPDLFAKAVNKLEILDF